MKNPYDDRPPKRWFSEMIPRLRREYGSHSNVNLNKIAAGIWYNMSEEAHASFLQRHKVSNPATVFLVTPKTRAAKSWVSENLNLTSLHWMGAGFAVGHQYIGNLVSGMESAGLLQGKDFFIVS